MNTAPPSPWRARLATLAALALPLAGCFNPIATDDDETQTWEFIGRNGNIVEVDCIPGGACTHASGSWEADFGGCEVHLNFDVQFSGSAVRLLLFRRGAGTTCTGFQQTATGTGTANDSYPRATQAAGESNIVFSTPIGPAGGRATWTAVRID